MADVEFVPDRAKIALFKSWQGTLGLAFARLEKETVWRQKQAAGVKTGALRASIESRRKHYATGLGFEAGSWTVKYAAVHELGSRPHPITPKKAGGTLVFFWPKAGRVVHFKSVMHPGTDPYYFASLGLERALRMWDRSG